MTDSQGMHMSKGSAHLIDIEFDKHQRHGLSQISIISNETMNGIWNVIQYQMQIAFVQSGDGEAMVKFDDIGMIQYAHDLQFTALVSLVQTDFFDAHLDRVGKLN